eukprot:scaffold7868_cov350-Prasinococcus_capsulatus_cf.AAC.2
MSTSRPRTRSMLGRYWRTRLARQSDLSSGWIPAPEQAPLSGIERMSRRSLLTHVSWVRATATVQCAPPRRLSEA